MKDQRLVLIASLFWLCLAAVALQAVALPDRLSAQDPLTVSGLVRD